MAKQNKSSGSGNDGSWFLEAVGAVPTAPTPSETVASLESDNTVTDLQPVVAAAGQDVVFSSLDGETGTSTAAFEAPSPLLASAADSILADDALPAAEAPVPLVAERADDTDLSPVLHSRRSFRWPVALIGLLAVSAVAVAAFWLPSALRQDATQTKQSYADASLALRVELPNGQAALDTVTDPASSAEELSAAVPVISQLDSVAHALGLVAAEPLPRQLPVRPIEEIAELGAFQDTAQIHAAQGSDIARRLGHSYVYRTSIPHLLTTGDLPLTTDVQTINALSVSLASSLVEDSNTLGDLPLTDETADLHDAAHSAVERHAFWQDEYLEALAEGDTTATTTLLQELENARTDLDDILFVSLGNARIEIDRQIVALAASLETYLEALTR